MSLYEYTHSSTRGERATRIGASISASKLLDEVEGYNGVDCTSTLELRDWLSRGTYHLVAGTAWLFAREELNQALDYLFHR